MHHTLPAIRPIELAEIKEARQRIAGTILRTPLVRLELGPDFPDIRLELENLQPVDPTSRLDPASELPLIYTCWHYEPASFRRSCQFPLNAVFLPMLQREQPKTRQVIEAIPLDKGDYRPDPVSKSALELAWHIVAAEKLDF